MSNANISLIIQAALSAGTVFLFRERVGPSQWYLNCQIVPSKLYHNTGIKNSLNTQVNAIIFVTVVAHAAWLSGTSVTPWLQGPLPFTHMLVSYLSTWMTPEELRQYYITGQEVPFSKDISEDKCFCVFNLRSFLALCTEFPLICLHFMSHLYVKRG